MSYKLSYEEFESQTRMLLEVAKWDDARKRKIDKAFVSFSKGEEYEPKDLYEDIEEVLKARDITMPREDLEKVVDSCDKKIARNNPRRQLLSCVLSHYGINIEDVKK